MRRRLSTKGQGTISKEIRPGQVENPPSTTLEDVLGYMSPKGPAKTLEEMEAAISEGAKERK